MTPTGKSFRFVRASGRGEAKLCGRARGDSIVVLGLFVEQSDCEVAFFVPGLWGTNAVFTQVLQGFSRTTLAKPM